MPVGVATDIALIDGNRAQRAWRGATSVDSRPWSSVLAARSINEPNIGSRRSMRDPARPTTQHDIPLSDAARAQHSCRPTISVDLDAWPSVLTATFITERNIDHAR
jgi:hypothetical protein